MPAPPPPVLPLFTVPPLPSPAATLPGVPTSLPPIIAPPTPGLPAARTSLAGRVVGIDPGHNGLNYQHPSFINHQVWNGRAQEACDTTGTQTDSGYTESLYNIRVAQYLAADLRARGATVVFTRADNSGVGPCIDRRAEILNAAHSAVAIDIHADGGPPSGRGFAILEPVQSAANQGVLQASFDFGSDVRAAMLADTSMPVSTYDGVNGVAYRSDLAGLNLTTVPKLLIECGNLRSATDAALLTSDAFQRQVAAALTSAISTFLARRG